MANPLSKTADVRARKLRLGKTLRYSSQGNRGGPQAVIASTGSLWDLSVGETVLVLIDFVKITSFPVKQLVDPKATALRDSTAHISMSVETHMDVQQAAEAARFLRSSGKWTLVIAPAAQSVSSQSETYGGVMLQLRKFLKVTPLEDSNWNQTMWQSAVSPVALMSMSRIC